MKALLKFTLVMALMFNSFVGSANEPKLYLSTDKDSKSLVFQMEAQSEKSSIKLIDKDNYLIYSENIADKNDYIRKFDLGDLEDGTYLFEVEDSLRIIKYRLAIAEGNMEIVEKTAYTKPFFRKNGDMLYLNLLNLDQEVVRVKIYDSSNNVVLSEKLGNGLVIEKAFNFKNAFEDSYTVVIAHNDEAYYENVTVD